MCQNAARPAKLQRVTDPRSFGCGFAALRRFAELHSAARVRSAAQRLLRRGFGDNASAKLVRAMSFADFFQAATEALETFPAKLPDESAKLPFPWF